MERPFHSPFTPGSENFAYINHFYYHLHLPVTLGYIYQSVPRVPALVLSYSKFKVEGPVKRGIYHNKKLKHFRFRQKLVRCFCYVNTCICTETFSVSSYSKVKMEGPWFFIMKVFLNLMRIFMCWLKWIWDFVYTRKNLGSFWKFRYRALVSLIPRNFRL